MAAKPQLLFVVTEDWYFASHRLELARAALSGGFRVGIATRVDGLYRTLQQAGLEVFPLQMLRRMRGQPLQDVRAIAELTSLYRSWRPDIVHHVAAKPIVLGGLAAQRARVPAVISAIAGMGYVYASTSARARLLRPVMRAAYRRALRHPNARLIVQNPDDERIAIEQRLIDPHRIRRIAGAGVDTFRYAPSPESVGPPVLMFVGRMLRDKGVIEFVEAARKLRTINSALRCVLVGEPDAANPASLTVAQLKAWQVEGVVEWWGHREDMPVVLKQAHVVCLPSYREGLPKTLLEAAASGRALIATDVPGCREVVLHGQTGLLVPPRDAVALVAAMKKLADDDVLRQTFGHNARELVMREFSAERVHRESLAVYRELLGGSTRTVA